MPRSRPLTRRHCRNLAIRRWRKLDRPALRALPGHRRGLDDLAQALSAFTRAIRCRRRLAKLAPSFFDSAVVDREAHERLERLRWMAKWEPLLAQVYGPEAAAGPRAATEPDHAPLPGPRTQRAVERELAGWDFFGWPPAVWLWLAIMSAGPTPSSASARFPV